jgi:valine dehydrogenase (NAD+)
VRLFERIHGENHEQVVYCHDRQTGLRAIIAIHSTRLGPALGGTRFYPYDAEDEALEDVLRLSRGMTYKAAAAGLDLGGGKAVIIGDPAMLKSEALLRTYGRFVDSLGGRYVTAEDVGTTQADMDLIRRETPHVAGVSQSLGGSGDPSAATAFGVLQGMKAGAAHLWGSPELADRHVVVAGAGKVGYGLARHLVEERARVTVSDISKAALDRARADLGVEVVRVEDAYTTPCDILAPCALGATLNHRTIPNLRCALVAGAANNQLADAGCAKLLADSGVVWCPDFIINAGGIINIAEELGGYHRERAFARIRGIYATTAAVLAAAQADGTTTADAADRLAETRIAELERLASLRVRPRRGYPQAR